MDQEARAASRLDAATTALWAVPASRLDRRLAAATIVVSVLVFAAAVGFARVPLPKVLVFIPIYQSALAVSDLVTAALLVGQFMIHRSRALRAIVCAYVFTGLMALVHMFSFPGLFAPAGWLGGDQHTTAWLYMFWHSGFPLGVIAYARLQGDVRGSVGQALGSGAAAVVVAVVVLAVLATGQIVPMPPIMSGNHYTPLMKFVVGAVWLLSGAALAVMWRRRFRSVLDVWLTVVMVAWVFDIALSAVFNAGRFDLGFYLGRVFGLLAATFVLVVLLVENGWLYARLVDITLELRRLMSADALTGIGNRRAFDEVLQEEWNRAQRHGGSLALLMIDVDHFKAYNDFYGHVAGDACLQRVAGALAHATHRAGDVVARVGGEEFAVLMPDTGVQSAEAVARIICEAVAGLRIAHAASATAPHVTVSVGVAACTPRPGGDPGRAALTPVSLMEAADAALYAAKVGGRDRTHVFDHAGTAPMGASADPVTAAL